MTILEYISANKEWLFSGIGVLVITAFFGLTRRSPNAPDAKNVKHTHEIKISNESSLVGQPPDETTKFDNRITFADGVFARVFVDGVVQIIDPYAYTSSKDSIDMLKTLIDSHLRQTLESVPISEARTRRKELEEEIIEKVQDTFNKHGVKLISISIGNIIEIT